MRRKDEGLMNEILKFVDGFHDNNMRTPSISEIASALHIAKSTAQTYLVAMAERDMLTYTEGQITTKQMSRFHYGITNAPVIGTISCGIPETAESYIEEYLPLPRAIFGSGEMYILRADGYSMVNAGINPGDYVVVRKQNSANAGDIIVALVDNSENTLKRMMWDEKQERYYLHPENDTMSDMYFDNIQIQGVAIHVIKPLI